MHSSPRTNKAGSPNTAVILQNCCRTPPTSSPPTSSPPTYWVHHQLTGGPLAYHSQHGVFMAYFVDFTAFSVEFKFKCLNIYHVFTSCVSEQYEYKYIYIYIYIYYFLRPIYYPRTTRALPPSSNSDPWSDSGPSFPLPTTVRAFNFVARRIQHFLPSSTRVELCLL